MMKNLVLKSRLAKTKMKVCFVLCHVLSFELISCSGRR